MKIESLNSHYRYEVDQVDKHEWSEIIQHFDDATIYQTWSYGLVRWGEGNLSHLVLKKGDEVIGLAQSIIKRLPIVKAGIAYIPWGPIWHRHGEELNYDTLHQLLKVLKQEYVLNRGLLLRITPKQIEGHDDRITIIYITEGFKRDPSVVSNRTLMLDLTPSLEYLRKNFAQKWRNQLNRAEKNNLKIVEGTRDELYETFLVLLKQMLARKGFVPGVDYNEFREIQKDLPDPHKMKIMVCEFEGEPICAAICSAIGNTGIYLLGATANRGMKLKGSYLLQWRMIQWLKEQGCQWYDLGGINPDKNPGVYHFKAGIAGKSGKDAVRIGQFEMCGNIISSSLVRIGDMLRTILKK
jgi:lipid II:glycine glycyltransferase (peptidoglycan interpeptide bridge formation enzyme)